MLELREKGQLQKLEKKWWYEKGECGKQSNKKKVRPFSSLSDCWLFIRMTMLYDAAVTCCICILVLTAHDDDDDDDGDGGDDCIYCIVAAQCVLV